VDLPAGAARELDDLGRRYGAPATVDALIDDTFSDPIFKRDRYGEVCMVIRRPNAKLLVAIKTFYPRGAYRLPTGGIHHGEGILDALVREAEEETGLDTTVERFLARIAYRGTSGPQAEPMFHTFAFLLSERGGRLETRDPSERLEDWREIETADLPRVADFLDDLRTPGTEDIGGDWAAWGRFRAVVHRAVHEALSG
jgi:8-oxo-dGTP pyrophosphatase MutT (NUDIX family)